MPRISRFTFAPRTRGRSRSSRKRSRLCEDAFVNNPWDVGAARIAAESAEGLGWLNVAQWFVESVVGVTKDVDFLKYAARVFEANESWAKAISCWEKVKQLHPNDQDANRQINALSASSDDQAGQVRRRARRKERPRKSRKNRWKPRWRGSSTSSSRRSSG